MSRRSRWSKCADLLSGWWPGFLSDDGTEVAFIEVFPPMELSVWKARFYEAPGTFYK